MSLQEFIIGPFSQLITMEHLPLRGPINNEMIRPVLDGGLLIENGLIKEVGKFEDLCKSNPSLGVHEILGHKICIPGYLDMHTHICFDGTRSRDFAMRNQGISYLDIAKAGGGIWETVTQTRTASQDRLSALVVERSKLLLDRGITTIEVKSGYGLSVDEELKMLRAIQLAQEKTSADLIPTCLAAHIKPKDFDGNHKEYLQWISEELFPILTKENLTNRIDAFVEEEAFSPKITKTYFQTAKNLGFDICVHADQFHPGGSELAIACGAQSADHLEASGDKEIMMLAKSQTTAVALPGASIGIGCAFTPARKLLDAGASLAIASDWNPGSAPMGDLITQASILATFEKLSNAEVLAALTFRAAIGLGLSDRGILGKGMLADFSIYDASHHFEILYHQGQLQPTEVWKNGMKIKLTQ